MALLLLGFVVHGCWVGFQQCMEWPLWFVSNMRRCFRQHHDSLITAALKHLQAVRGT
jgi:hypothetical protein